MSRWLTGLLLALVVLGGVDAWLRHERAAARAAFGVLRPLVDPARQVVPERVRSVRLIAPGLGDWSYERRGDTWRFPAYFDAWVHGDRMGAFLEQLLTSGGTLATDDADEHDELGLTEAQALRVVLAAADGAPLADILLGRGTPGPAGEESFVRLAGQDRVLHLHANPSLLLGDARPPLLDPSLLPRDLPRRAATDVAVAAPAGAYRLRRILAPLPASAPPLPADERERYRWVLERGAAVDTCVDVSVYAWLSWLRGARFTALVDPAPGGYGLGEAGRLELTYEDDARDGLRLGRAAAGDNLYVDNEAAGIVTVMPAARARWLLPPPRLFLEPLSDPSPFESIP